MALNSRGLRILISSSQFYSEQQNRPVTIYHIKQAFVNENTGRTDSIELFKSPSQIQVVLYLRDMWYDINGWEIPDDNEVWNNIKNNNPYFK